MPEFATALVPLLAEYQHRNPELAIEMIADRRLLKLEYGEAHVSLRAERPPSEPDNIVQKLVQAAATLRASRDYVARHGGLKGLEEIDGHRFVSTSRDETATPLAEWIHANVPDDAVAFRAGDVESITAAVANGVGIGPVLCWPALANEELVPMIPPPPDWFGTLWLVTHVDLHHTAKVQSFLAFMKQAVAARLDDITGASVRRRLAAEAGL